MRIRRLGPGDESVVAHLAIEGPPVRAQELLADRRTIFLVAFDGEDPIGFVLAYELVRRHGDPTRLFVYEIEVDEARRRRGVARSLFRELAKIAREQGIRRGWVLTERSNEEAMSLYRSVGGVEPTEEIKWSFDYWER
jgi:ribosomal protein S18 acetylase RimI-like enzyme